MQFSLFPVYSLLDIICRLWPCRQLESQWGSVMIQLFMIYDYLVTLYGLFEVPYLLRSSQFDTFWKPYVDIDPDIREKPQGGEPAIVDQEKMEVIPCIRTLKKESIWNVERIVFKGTRVSGTCTTHGHQKSDAEWH